MNLTIRIAHSIHGIAPDAWDGLSTQPFQSHRWYQFGERVMADCEPVYLLAYHNERPVGRASLWVIRDEPLPIGPGAGRVLLKTILRHWPLLVCRSPLSNASGLALPSGPSRDEALRALAASAREVCREKRCSFLVFDFLSQESSQGWPDGFLPLTVSDPGTVLQSRWRSLEEYLADGNKKDRQHYKRTLREAEKFGITIERYTRVPDVSAALNLIREVDQRYKNEPSPWTRGLLENLDFANGIWLEARQNGRLIGCGASFVDNGAQLTTALGAEANVPYAYLLLTYACMEEAFSTGVRLLRWGSGAYEVKRQLGFELELTNNAMVSSECPLLQFGMRRFM